MDTVWYEGPSGSEFIPTPTPEQMREILRRPYDTYWGPYQPIGLLEWHRHSSQDVPTRIGLGTATKKGQLLFVAHPERGWYFELNDLVPYDAATDRGEWVEHWGWGEPMYYRAACFVSLELADQIVEEFLTSHERSPLVTWARSTVVDSRLTPDQWRERQD